MPDTMTETEAFDLMEKWIDRHQPTTYRQFIKAMRANPNRKLIRTARRYSEHFVTYGGWYFDPSGNYGESHA